MAKAPAHIVDGLRKQSAETKMLYDKTKPPSTTYPRLAELRPCNLLRGQVASGPRLAGNPARIVTIASMKYASWCRVPSFGA